MTSGMPRRDALRMAFKSIKTYEEQLLLRLLEGLKQLDGIKVWGITDPTRVHERCPTISITHERFSPRIVAERLAEHGIFVWDGNYYALPLTERLGVEPEGMIRIGLVHYNTASEVDRLLDHLGSL